MSNIKNILLSGLSFLCQMKVCKKYSLYIDIMISIHEQYQPKASNVDIRHHMTFNPSPHESLILGVNILI